MKIAIVGCGIIGVLLAYELSAESDYSITVLESHSQPVTGATGAALGLLMGVISQKIKGRAWQWRQTGLEYYQQLLPELARTGFTVQHNQQGLLKLITDPADLPQWQSLAHQRISQGWPLEIWERSQVLDQFPFLQLAPDATAVYSPADWQLNPAQLGRSIVSLAIQRGVQFHWNTPVISIQAHGLQLAQGQVEADWIIVASGLGSIQVVPDYLELVPVLGQAIHCRIPMSCEHPVITHNDVHVVPLGWGEYWVGATVEFPIGAEMAPATEVLASLWKGAITYFPSLAQAEILSSWSGLRPRPVGRPAPVVERLPVIATPHSQVILATGHYRNGVLLAPATVQMVREILK